MLLLLVAAPICCWIIAVRVARELSMAENRSSFLDTLAPPPVPPPPAPVIRSSLLWWGL